eukprot:gene19176-21811_t
MVWMCLEFCEDSQHLISSDLKEISDHRNALSAV